MSETEDLKYLQQLHADSEEAFDLIYHRYHKRLYSFAFKYLKSRELAEDAVQDTFIKLWMSRDKITSNVKGFLFTSARNHVLNMIRNNKRKVLKHIQFEQQKAKPANKTDDVILFSEYQQILADGLEKLPDGKKEIFKMKTVQGLSNHEIATELDITVNTVKSQYYQASKLIREYMHKNAGIKFNGS